MKRLLASCFGLGWLPLAPGTWGSLPPVFVFALAGALRISALPLSIVMAVLALAGSVLCIKLAPALIAATGRTDPREIVVDEFAGQALTFIIPICAVSSYPVWLTALMGFLLFRVFDVLKPWPIHKCENLPNGWGILLDDLLAGIYAGIVLLICLRTGLVQYLNATCRFDPSSLNVLSAAILGAVQGLTEFLPVSSSGHLVLLENFFDFQPERPEMLLFDLVVHVGTVAAIFIVFRKSIAAFFKNLLCSGKYANQKKPSCNIPSSIVHNRLIQIYTKSPSVHLLVLAVVATIVTGVVGLLFEKHFTSARGNLAVVASMWVITATLLLITDWRKKPRLGLRQFSVSAAVVVGLAQAAAIMPGISRSGATICAAILIGLHRRWAVEFSFLIAIPAILGAAAIQLVKNFGQISPDTLPIGCVVTGSAAAALVGILALKLLIKTSRTANLKFFAFYCYFLAFFVWAYLLK